MTREHYICIHGHFYQPARNNAWLEYIEQQESAHPYHDWNERVTAECYAPNAAARILGEKDYITEIVSNYAKISFDFGPILLVWLEKYAPEVYSAILDADRESQRAFSGHGSAMAMAYNHIILPLANSRDKYTQIFWGIKDFEHRFGRQPEGMWLPETAVDLETLGFLAELGVKFTIIAPHQAKQIRQIGSSTWQDVGGGKINSRMAYELNLPSKRKISLFFFDDATARDVAFGGLLGSGVDFAQRLSSALAKEDNRPLLVHIATDGETYGHHHRFGDMALAYALNYIETNNLARITNYGEYLEKNPPTYEVKINENTSWSCVHGVERWRSDCGCSSGTHPGWNQAWRAPLRQALDWLRDRTTTRCEEKASQLLKDLWSARNDYIQVINDRSPDSIERFLSEHASRTLNDAEKITAMKLLELQRYAMLMYASDAWFFDEVSGIETVQCIQYAGRVIQLAEELFGEDVENPFLEIMRQAKSNLPEQSNGRSIYERLVKPARVDLSKVAAHYAVSSLFDEYNRQAKIYCYGIDVEDYRRQEAGEARLAIGRARVTAETTLESSLFNFGALYSGPSSLNAGVREFKDKAEYDKMVQEINQAFSRADFPDVIRLFDRYFGTSTLSLKSLFHDDRRHSLSHILESTLSEVESIYRQVYQHNYPLMLLLADLNGPLPGAFRSTAEFILDSDLRRAFREDNIDLKRIEELLNASKIWRLTLDKDELGICFQQALEKMMEKLTANPDDMDLLKNLVNGLALARSTPFVINLWKVQNLYYKMLKAIYPGFRKRADQKDEKSRDWIANFALIGEYLSIQV
ncbi:MAG: DUF3536 domain-containing protein [Chloroflexota bacterium]